MKQLFRLSMFIFLLLAPILANADDTNGLKTRDAVIFNGGRPHKLIEVQPEGWYYYETQVLTIEFPVAGFEPYTLHVLRLVRGQQQHQHRVATLSHADSADVIWACRLD